MTGVIHISTHASYPWNCAISTLYDKIKPHSNFMLVVTRKVGRANVCLVSTMHQKFCKHFKVYWSHSLVVVGWNCMNVARVKNRVCIWFLQTDARIVLVMLQIYWRSLYLSFLRVLILLQTSLFEASCNHENLHNIYANWQTPNRECSMQTDSKVCVFT